MPAGIVLGRITDSESKTNTNGNEVLNIEFTIDAPPEHKGRKLFDRVNTRNSNPTAQKIGGETLSQICHATNILRPTDSVQFYNIPIAVRVAIEKAQMDENDESVEKFPARNVIGDYLPAAKYTGPAATAGAVAPPTGFGPQFGTPTAPPAAPVAPSAAAGWPTAAAAPAPAPVAPPAPAPAPVAPTVVAAQISPDGQWRFENGGWVANTPPPAAAPAAVAPPPAAAPAAPAAGPWADAPTAPAPVAGPRAQG